MAESKIYVEFSGRQMRSIRNQQRKVAEGIAFLTVLVVYYVYKNEKEKKELKERIEAVENRVCCH